MKAQEAKVATSPAVIRLAEARSKVLAEQITIAETAQVKRDDESRITRAELDKMKAEQEEIAAFLKAN